MDREEILLKEYEVCQQAINSISSRFWVIVGIFLTVNTAISGWIVTTIISNPINIKVDWIEYITKNVTWLILISILGISLITILLFLLRWLYRINSFNHATYYRMREIEQELRMRRNWIIHSLDNWESLSNEQKIELIQVKKGYSTHKETKSFRVIMIILMLMWLFSIIFAWILPVINRIIS